MRVQLSQHADGALHTLAQARQLEPDAGPWRAITAPHPHPGPGPAPGAKLSARLVWTLAAEAARAAGAQEALLFDVAGRLVEGSRSNLLVLDSHSQLLGPPPERGAVAGIALAIVSEGRPDLRLRDLSREALRGARAVVALNAVRGARALQSLDGEALGDGGETLAAQLNALLEAEAGNAPPRSRPNQEGAQT